MSLEDVVRKAIDKSPKIQQAIAEEGELRYKLSEIVDGAMDRYRYLQQAARFVDKANRILGPAEAVLRYASALGTAGFGIYSLGKLLHYGLLKLPYTAYYTLKTGDLKGAGLMTLAEIAKYVAPFGTAADILPMNQWMLDKHIVKYAVREMENYLEEREGQEFAKGEQLYLRKGRFKIPRRMVADYNARVSGDKVYVDVPSQGYELRSREVEDGVHELYLERKKGTHPQVLTTLEMSLPKDVKKLRIPKQGMMRQAA